MSLRQYFKVKEGIPDPGGSLSNAVPPAAIRSANREWRRLWTPKGIRNPEDLTRSKLLLAIYLASYLC